ncbi:MAG: hypothetical protein KDD38_07020 [Bdellovibrionales bacterium]|nr:hypothetical protein [Bdellovibrionales bacterium]
MKYNRNAKMKLVVITSMFMMFTLSACNKGLSRPESWNSSSLLMAKCDSSRAFNMEDLNKHRELLKLSDEAIIAKTSVEEDKGATTSAAITTMAVLPVDVKVDCKTLTATYSGPVVAASEEDKADVAALDGDESSVASKNLVITQDSITGELVDIGVDSIKIKGEAMTVTVERVLPDKKADRAGYAKAIEDQKNGYNTFKISIEDPAAEKVTVLKQDVGLDLL